MKFFYVTISDNQYLVDELVRTLRSFRELENNGNFSEYNHALNSILQDNPHIVFIDIDISPNAFQGDTFHLIYEMYQFLDTAPILIAISSSKGKAYDAIKMGFFDFLLKPLQQLEIRKAIFRIKKKRMAHPEKLCVKSYSDFRFIDLDQILYLKADNNTTDLYFREEKKVTAYKSLKTFKELLPSKFVRVHNSYIINSDYITRINFARSLLSLDKDTYKIPFSKSYRGDVEILKSRLFREFSLQV